MAIDKFLVNGLGGAAGFGENTLAPGNDNSSATIDLTSIFAGGLDFLGTIYTAVFVNTNGTITFGGPSDVPSGFIPSHDQLNFGEPEVARIAAFWTDADTTGAGGAPTPGGNSTGSNRVYWDLDTANRVFTVTWDDVGYPPAQTAFRNAFQLQLTDRGGGDFEVLLRYESLEYADAHFGIEAADNRYISGYGSLGSLDISPGNTGIEGVYQYTVRTGGAGGDTVNGTEGADLIDGGDGNDELNGAAGDDRLYGGAGEDLLEGGDGHDQLDGGAGNDGMIGGAGDDLYFVDHIYDVVLESSSLDGFDFVIASVDYSLADVSFVEGLSLGSVAEFGEGNELSNSIFGNEADNVLLGKNGNDVIDGSGGNDHVIGGGDNDTLNGGIGDDTLDGGAGDDTLTGGEGSDTASYVNVGTAVTVSLATSDAQDTFGSGTDTLSGIENLTGGSADDTLTGDEFDNILEGGPGDDVLNGGAGSDTASYARALDGVVVSLLALGAQDTLGAGIDTLTGFESLLGGSGDDLLSGNAFANTLDGGAGADVLFGGAGADTLIVDAADLAVMGGSGIDTLGLRAGGGPLDLTTTDGRPFLSGIDVIDLGAAYGGSLTLDPASLAIADGSAGSRVLRVDGEGIVGLTGTWSDGGEVTVGSEIYRQYTAASGDTLQVHSNLALLTGRAPATQSARLGTDASDVLGGTLEADAIQGLNGSDQLSGRGGADVLMGGDGFDNLQGGPGDDVLLGGADNDFLNGGTGNDALFGGAGTDNFFDSQGSNALHGGGGADIFNVGGGTNVATGGAGRDTYQPDFFTFAFSPGVANDFRVTDFEIGGFDELSNPTGDLIDAAFLLDFSRGFVGGNPFNASVGVFRLLQEGPDTLFQWDSDGAAGSSVPWRTLIRLEDTNALDLTAAHFVGGGLRPDGLPEPGVNLVGDDTGNTLNGTHSNDVLTGLGGTDNLFGKAGNDEIDGGDGNDNLAGGPGDDVLIGGAGNDSLQEFSFASANDVLKGEAGDDTLWASSGLMEGGDGADNFTLLLSTTSLVATGGEGQDSFALWTPSADIEVNARITDFDAGPDGDKFEIFFFGGTSYAGGNPYAPALGFLRVVQDDEDTLVQWDRDGAADDEFEWATLATLEDVDVSDLTQDNVTGLYPLDGSDVPGVTRDGTPGQDTLIGTISDDILNGFASSDLLNGDAGDDVMAGGGGDDILDGGLGDDVISGGDGDDNFGGGGAFGNVILLGGEGGSGNDVLNGGAGDDRFFDTRGDNVLNGGDGADSFSWSAPGMIFISLDPSQAIPKPGHVPARNTATGGAGRDTYNADSSELIDFRITDFAAGPGGDILNVMPLLEFSEGYSGGSPFDPAARFFRLVQSGANTLFQWDEDGLAGGHKFETVFTLLGVSASSLTSDNFGGELIVGTADADDLVGTIGNDHLQGLGGDDSLDGLLGSDLMEGGTGNDLYIVDNAGDDVVETSNEPDSSAPGALTISAANVLEGVSDTVLAAVDYSLENRQFVEHLTLALAASAAIKATGNALSNKLTGNEFQNTLYGRGGDDLLNGGGGLDTALYVGNKGLYTVTRAGAALTVSSDAEGTDTLTFIEKLQFANGVTLLGGSGADAWTSTTANETFDGGAGVDTVSYANATAQVAASLGAIGEQNTGSAGTDAFVGIENLTGSAFNDVLTGDDSGNVLRGTDGRDSLFGQAGNDTLEGGTGNDTLEGGIGLDTASYAGATAGVTVNLALADPQNTRGGGTDTLVSIEGLLGTAHADTLTGNGVANALSGGNGDDILTGGGGSDTLIGGAGNDTYSVDATQDTVTEASSAGTDLVRSTASNYTLSPNVENLTLLGSAGLNGTGNSGSNRITGNAGNNRLNGDAGSDTLIGDAGNDTYVVNVAQDAVTEASGGGTDLVQSTATGSGYTLSANVENLLLLGSGNLKGAGNSAANVLTGNAGNNALSGGAGNDTLNGGLGDDTLAGGDGNDTLIGGDEVDTLIGGAGSDVLRGLAGADVLTGGAGADRFDFDFADDTGTLDTTRDTVSDFKDAQGDKIDLSTIDANGEGAGDTAFTFIRGAFSITNAAGQLRFDAGRHLLLGSTDADADAEFSILLTGVNNMTGANFIL